ncbi:MAG TPA: cupin domain-containing protein [Rhizomicrobium sp.]|nr:cupin domain-containing protein [Rhizomicrobium sp.]
MLNIVTRDAIMRLRESASDYAELIQDGRFDLGLYQPVDMDSQTPHARDELYIVARGGGRFTCAGETKPFTPGDVFFVPAGTDHRFVEFSEDFATWVIFFAKRG